MADELQALVGQTLNGRFRLDQRVGSGASGELFRGLDLTNGRMVAVKVLRGGASADFKRSAQAVVALDHPNIVKIYDADQDAARGVNYVAMQWLPGGALDTRQKYSLMQVVAIIKPLAQALDYAHSRGVIHQAIKNNNILLDEQGRPTLTDFTVPLPGLNDSTNTNSGPGFGLLTHVSPEQCQGQPASPASDQYSLGVLTYELVTGQMPFNPQPPTPMNYMLAHMNTPAPKPWNVPEPVAFALLRALAKQPGSRYPNALAFALDFERAALDPTRGSLPPPPPALPTTKPPDDETFIDLASPIVEPYTGPTEPPQQTIPPALASVPVSSYPGQQRGIPFAVILLGLIAVAGLALGIGALIGLVATRSNEATAVAVAPSATIIGTSVTTIAPTSAPTIPTTSALTTEVPATAIPTTLVPTTVVPPTAASTTAIPTTAVPPTAIPTTRVPPTAVPTTALPNTVVPTIALVDVSTPLPETNTAPLRTSTAIPPTNTPIPASNTPNPPTNTALPPTATAIPPTNTPISPTNTAVPPTNTPIPPTNTAVPPTVTAIPPSDTAIPPTATPIPPGVTPTEPITASVTPEPTASPTTTPTLDQNLRTSATPDLEQTLNAMVISTVSAARTSTALAVSVITAEPPGVATATIAATATVGPTETLTENNTGATGTLTPTPAPPTATFTIAPTQVTTATISAPNTNTPIPTIIPETVAPTATALIINTVAPTVTTSTTTAPTATVTPAVPATAEATAEATIAATVAATATATTVAVTNTPILPTNTPGPTAVDTKIRLIFGSNRGGFNYLYTLRADGSGARQLTELGTDLLSISPAPDGTQIAYVSTLDGSSQIYTVDLQGLNPLQLTSTTTTQNQGRNNTTPAWSPDGRFIVFTSDRDQGRPSELYRMDVDGSNQRRLTNNTATDSDVAWSPDAKKIVFNSDRTGNTFQLFTANPDGSGQTSLTRGTSENKFPDWSPDGEQIVFLSNRGATGDADLSSYQIWVLSVANPTEARQLGTLDNPTPDVRPRWSPDGKQIAFSAKLFNGNWAIFVMNADGSGMRQLSNDRFDEGRTGVRWITLP